jgi:hypothetical protein
MVTKTKKRWMKVDPMTFQINRINNRLVQGDDEFAVWGLGRDNGLGVKWADITKRTNGYEIAVGRKDGKKRWREMHPTRDIALKNLIKKMRTIGKIQGGKTKW